MSGNSPGSTGRQATIGVLVSIIGKKVVLSPFFAKAEGLMIIDCESHTSSFETNPEKTSDATRSLILRSGTRRLICGFITTRDRNWLNVKGIDTRLGTCSSPVGSLIEDYDNLPAA